MSRTHMIYNETSHDAEVHIVTYPSASKGGKSWAEVTNKGTDISYGMLFSLGFPGLF